MSGHQLNFPGPGPGSSRNEQVARAWSLQLILDGLRIPLFYMNLCKYNLFERIKCLNDKDKVPLAN